MLLVRKKMIQWLIAFLLTFAVGGHWAFLQSAAWLGMVVSYSQNAPFSIALENTFDGQHPCGLCKLVQEGKKSERQRGLLKAETKLNLLLAQARPWLLPPLPFSLSPTEPGVARIRLESPPTPPPRLA